MLYSVILKNGTTVYYYVYTLYKLILPFETEVPGSHMAAFIHHGYLYEAESV